jgi:two-component system cell cycle sensor histidine kinase/response regulator CckA
MEKIQSVAERATSLTSGLLALSHQQVGQQKILDLNSLIRSRSNMVERLIGEDIELTTCLASDLGLIRADRGQVEQVLVNLAVNARDAMVAGGKLVIETSNVEIGQTSDGSHVNV